MRVRWRTLGGEWREVDTSAGTVLELMKELGLSPEEYIPSVGGKVVPPDYVLSEGDEVTFVPVVSGG